METHATAVQESIIEIAKCVTELRSQIHKTSFVISKYTKQAAKQMAPKSFDNLDIQKVEKMLKIIQLAETLEGFANYGTYGCQRLDDVLDGCAYSAERMKDIVQWMSLCQADPVRNVPLKEIADELDYWCSNE